MIDESARSATAVARFCTSRPSLRVGISGTAVRPAPVSPAPVFPVPVFSVPIFRTPVARVVVFLNCSVIGPHLRRKTGRDGRWTRGLGRSSAAISSGSSSSYGSSSKPSSSA